MANAWLAIIDIPLRTPLRRNGRQDNRAKFRDVFVNSIVASTDSEHHLLALVD